MLHAEQQLNAWSHAIAIECGVPVAVELYAREYKPTDIKALFVATHIGMVVDWEYTLMTAYVVARCHYGLLRNAWTGGVLSSSAKQELDALLKQRKNSYKVVMKEMWEARKRPWMAGKVRKRPF